MSAETYSATDDARQPVTNIPAPRRVSEFASFPISRSIASVRNISVIVPTLNRATSLQGTLATLVRQDLAASKYEIVVVDNGSTDETPAVVQAAIRAHPQHTIRYLVELNPGLLAGRHRGFRESAGDVLVYVDDDIEAPAGWLSTIHDCFQDPEVAMVGGNVMPKFESAPPAWLAALWRTDPNGGRLLGYLALVDMGTEPKWMNYPLRIFGCNFPIRRNVLQEVGGFHPDVYYGRLIRYLGDSETFVTHAVAASNRKVRFHPGASVFHLVPKSRMSVDYMCRRAYADGIRDSFAELRAGDDLHGSKLQSRRRTLRGRLGDFWQGILEKAHIETRWLVWRKIWISYHAGYAFHRQEVKRDAQLWTWVTKEHYWDCSLPGEDAALNQPPSASPMLGHQGPST